MTPERLAEIRRLADFHSSTDVPPRRRDVGRCLTELLAEIDRLHLLLATQPELQLDEASQ